MITLLLDFMLLQALDSLGGLGRSPDVSKQTTLLNNNANPIL